MLGVRSPRGRDGGLKSVLVPCLTRRRIAARFTHTDVKQDCAVHPLVHDMVLEDLIVESLWSSLCGRHLD